MTSAKRNNLVSFSKNLATLLVAGFFVCAILFGFTQNIEAQENNGESIKNFKTTLEINADSSVSVKETIVYDFGPNERHGIFRDIPITKVAGAVRYLYISDVTVTDETGKPYTTDVSGGGSVTNIRIGDPNVLVTGKHTYVISYTLENAIGYFDSYDELYWNVTGNEWQVPIENAEAEIVLPKNIPAEDLQSACYIGSSGSTESCATASSTLLFSSPRTLFPYEGLTVAVGFPKDTVAPPVIMWWEKSETYYLIAGAIFSFFFFIFLLWLLAVYLPKYNKNKRPIIASYEPPKDITPARAGYIYSYYISEGKMIMLDILHLASLGFISITEEDVKGKEKTFARFSMIFLYAFLGIFFIGFFFHISFWILFLIFLIFRQKKVIDLYKQFKQPKTFSFFRLKDSPFLENPPHLRTLLSAITYAGEKGKSVKDISSENKYHTFKGIISAIKSIKSSEEDKTNRKFPLRTVIFIMYFFFFFVFTTFASTARESVLPPAIFTPVLSFIGSIAVFSALKAFLSMRLAHRTLLWYEIAGLREYINVAEKDRLIFEHDPKKSLQIFSTLFPYAIAFGLEEKWTHLFEGIIKSTPEWYTSSSSSSLSHFSSSFGALSSSIGSAARSGAPVSSGGSSSSSGGSSGGGSSGGGGGGGGGGSW